MHIRRSRHIRPMALAEFAILIFILSLLLLMVLIIVSSTGHSNRYLNFPTGSAMAAAVSRIAS
ncbi:MAG TPA: hypothetical protein VFA04_26590 [Bryobacteraceae bacterium]|nr:hypothetical protein [Bryobacteraceae bacterium]